VASRAILVELERGRFRKAALHLPRILRAAAWLDFRVDFTCSAIFFFAAEVSMEKPLAASELGPSGQRIPERATLRRSSRIVDRRLGEKRAAGKTFRRNRAETTDA